MSSVLLSRLFVHPLKSGRGQEVTRWPLAQTGLVHDRGLMLVDGHGHFVTLRGVPKLVLIEASPFAPGDTRFEFRVFDRPDLGTLEVHLDQHSGEREVEIWGEWVAATHMGARAEAWFSEALGRSVTLVQIPPERPRQVDLRYAAQGDQVGFADGFPLLLVASASLEAVSQALGEPVLMERFRPNLVVQTDEPWVEDQWRRIRIGEIELELVKPCARCVGINVDPLTAKTSREPLRTLARSRTRDAKVYFGHNVVHRGVGLLSVGDPVEVLESAAPT